MKKLLLPLALLAFIAPSANAYRDEKKGICFEVNPYISNNTDNPKQLRAGELDKNQFTSRDHNCCPAPSTMHYAHTIFLWDLHGVILTRDITRSIALSLSYPHKFKLFSNPRLVKAVSKIIWQAATSDAGTEKLIYQAHRENQPYLAQLIKNIGNAQGRIEQTIAILKNLHQQGYTHHLGSNIAVSIYQDIIDPQRYPQFADIFSCFDLKKSHPVTCTNGVCIRKPSTAYFTTYLQKHEIDPKKTRIIFIDDRCENVKAAQQAGLVSVHFKNALQLKADLKALGVTIH